VAWTDLHIAPTAQPDRSQIVLVCAHTLARTEGVGGRELGGSSVRPLRRVATLRDRWSSPASARASRQGAIGVGDDTSGVMRAACGGYQVLLARLKRMETDEASALDEALLGLYARFASVMEQLKLVLDRLPPGPARHGETHPASSRPVRRRYFPAIGTGSSGHDI
jgi:hypothetical protein